jgi:hypothetical protein
MQMLARHIARALVSPPVPIVSNLLMHVVGDAASQVYNPQSDAKMINKDNGGKVYVTPLR